MRIGAKGVRRKERRRMVGNSWISGIGDILVEEAAGVVEEEKEGQKF